jgi:hypothetical protein
MTVDLAITLLIALANNAGRISTAISQAQAEGRTELTDAEFDAIMANDDAARIRQEAALAKAKAEGR